MLGYKWSLLVASALSLGPGVFFILFPEATSTELMRSQAVELESFAEGFVEGQVFLVRLLGCWVLGFGVLCFVLSRIQDEAARALVLKGLILSATCTVVGSITAPVGWVSLVLSGAVVVVLVTGMLRQQLGEAA